MIRIFLIFALFIAFLAPTQAQEVAPEAVAQEPVIEGVIESADDLLGNADYENRLELSRQMHEMWPVRPKIETVLDRIAEQIEPQNRMRFKSAMRKAIKFQALEEASIDAMADIFTSDELTAMIAFYGSKEGRSVSFKTDDYERALQPVMTKMIDKALLDTKLGQ